MADRDDGQPSSDDLIRAAREDLARTRSGPDIPDSDPGGTDRSVDGSSDVHMGDAQTAVDAAKSDRAKRMNQQPGERPLEEVGSRRPLATALGGWFDGWLYGHDPDDDWDQLHRSEGNVVLGAEPSDSQRSSADLIRDVQGDRTKPAAHTAGTDDLSGPTPIVPNLSRVVIPGVQCSLCRKHAVPVMRRSLVGTRLKGDLVDEPPGFVCLGPTESKERYDRVNWFTAWRFRHLWHPLALRAIRRRGHSPQIVWSPTARKLSALPGGYYGPGI
jgi:hypothetical protein